jgi:predicted outer membrane repeat protein
MKAFHRLTFVSLLTLCISTPIFPQMAIYVNDDASGSNDGSSWTNAYNDLQNGLDASMPGDTIFIQQGIYKPSVRASTNPGCGTPQCWSFNIPDSVVIIGGWSIANTYDPSKFITLLSGDIGAQQDSSDNVFQVVTALSLDSSSILRGVHVRYGQFFGGYIEESPALSIEDCVFQDNYGTALSVVNSNFSIQNSDFIENNSSVAGAISLSSSHSVDYYATITDCFFSKNRAQNAVGALSGSNYGNIQVLNCEFDSNSCGLSGGAIQFIQNVFASIDSCLFSNNSAQGGGAINCVNQNLDISNCSFYGNSSTENGGAIRSSSPNVLSIIHSTFDSNSAGENGGAIYTRDSSVHVLSSSFEKNRADLEGGGIYLWRNEFDISKSLLRENVADLGGGGVYAFEADGRFYSSCFYRDSTSGVGAAIAMDKTSLDIVNNTFLENYSDTSSSIYCADNNFTFLNIYNSILWGDSNQIEDNGQLVEVAFSDIQGGYDGEGNIDIQPEFSIFGRPFDVTDSSATINAGDNDYLEIGDTLDYYDFNRIDLEIVDQGCSENPISIRRMAGNVKIYVDSSNTSGSQTGASWATAFSDLQNAIDLALPGDTILMAAGTYFPSEYPRNCVGCINDRYFTFHFKDSTVIIGGYPNGGGQRNILLNETILDGDIDSINYESDNVLHVCLISDFVNHIEIHGLTITNGFNSTVNDGNIQIDGSTFFSDRGAGMYIRNARVVISDVSFKTNSATFGAAIHATENSTNITCNSCSFIDNEALSNGAGIDMINGMLTIRKSIFQGNVVIPSGSLRGTSLNTVFTDSVRISNTLLDDSVGNNPAIVAFSDRFSIVNSSITQPILDTFPALMLYNNFPNTEYIIQNSVLPLDSNWVKFEDNVSVVVQNSIVDSSYSGSGNIHSDPIFMDPGTGDYRLRYNSPGRNAGDNAFVSSDDSLDLSRNPRIAEDTVDMGAYEYDLPGQRANRIYVDASASGNNDGSTWANAYNELYSGISAADSLDTLFIAKAIYFPKPILADPRIATFNIDEAMTLLGGFPAGGSRDEERDGNAFRAELSGNIGLDRDNSDNLYVVTTIDGDGQYEVYMRGLAIRHGNANDISFSAGGAMMLNQTAILDNVWIERNHSTKFGPVQFLSSNAKLVLNDCWLRLNSFIRFQSRSGGQVEVNEATIIE